MSHRIALPRLVAGCLVALGLSGAAQAALIDRGGGLIYDTDLNVTWLQNANAALGSSYDTADGMADGRMTWQNAVDWAANFSYYDSVRNVTYTDWRLPTTLQPDASCPGGYSGPYGYNCTGSEMGHLFYSELGGVAGQSIVTTHDADYNLFTNFQSYYYWSGTEYAPYSSRAWVFTNDGYQADSLKSNSFYALAVRPGDVAAVPEAQMYALMLAGLGLIGWRARRRG